ncbi:MAG: enoyl-CoA hydratase/isomerase family protein [Lachnospiraceae bacterium]|nr:enoyl-CoA hydratase/isomerase family protein [Lachnospiraceae bacterium]
MGKIMADYVHLPKFDEYKEWFKDHFELYREDGILQVTMHTNGHEMCWSGANHRAMSQLSHTIGADPENEVIIWTHKGDYWMKDKDPYGWQTYAEERFDHQYVDDYNLIKNMIFEINVPTIGAIPGPGFHWDSALLCDVTIASTTAKFDDDHLFFGLVPGDGMFLLMQQFMGVKRANYYAMTSRQWNAQQALDWGWVSELTEPGKTLERAWEIARIIKSVPREARMIFSHLCKRPLERLLVDDLKVHTTAEQYSTAYRLAQGDYGKRGSQVDEKDMSAIHHYRFDNDDHKEELQGPIHDYQTLWDHIDQWIKDTNYQSPDKIFADDYKD